jgi:hypothetical protein
MRRISDSMLCSGMVMLAIILLSPAAQADLTAHWVADDLDDGDAGGWFNRIDPFNSAITETGADPAAIPNALNGHKVVNFDGNDRFTVDAGAGNPMANVTDFSITTVFRTNTVGGGDANPNVWWSNSGLVSMERPGGVNDWGFVLNPNGQVVAGIGGPDRGVPSAITSGSLADGQPHVATYVRSGSQVRLFVDTHFHARQLNLASSARADQPFSIGSAQTFDSGGTHYTGDIAEIQIENMALADADIAVLHGNLIATYGITIPPPPPPPPPPPSGFRAWWNADDLLDDQGSPVNSWVDRIAMRPAVPRAGGGTPSLVTGSPNFNGHNAISFNKDELDQLRVAAANSPMAGNESFTVALVFRTNTAGVGDPGSQWWSNTGLVDAEQPGGTADWGIAFNNAGQVAGGVGGPDVTVNSVSELNDGNAHIAIFRLNSQTGETFLNVDDTVAMASGAAQFTPRNIADMVFGAIQTNEADRHFSGEIADIRVYADFLDDARTMALHDELFSTYVIPEPSMLGMVLLAVLSGSAIWRYRRRAA